MSKDELNAAAAIASLISLLVGMGSILMSIYYARLAKKTTDKQSDQTRRLTSKAESIADSLSTRFVGDFPGYLPKVASLISEAKYSIRIMAMVPSHGEYTDPDGWFTIRQAILAKIHQNTKNKGF